MNQLPRTYLSYSAFHLWLTNKDAYRRRYYENEKPFDTIETAFGKKTHDELEKTLDPRYSVSEHTVEVPMFGTILHGRLDKFDPKRLKFLDTKTGMNPWDKVRVKKLSQLVFYSMLIKEKYGKVDPVCHIIWLETRWKKKRVRFDGHYLEAQSRELELSGYRKKFSRRIYMWERKKILFEIKVAISQIRIDYAEYLKTKSQKSHVGVGQTLPQEVAPS